MAADRDFLHSARDAIEGNFRAPLTIFAVMGMLLLLTIWLLLFSGMRAKTRLIIFALELVGFAAIALLFKFALKMQGSLTGAGVPRMVWKWTPPPMRAQAAGGRGM